MDNWWDNGVRAADGSSPHEGERRRFYLGPKTPWNTPDNALRPWREYEYLPGLRTRHDDRIDALPESKRAEARAELPSEDFSWRRVDEVALPPECRTAYVVNEQGLHREDVQCRGKVADDEERLLIRAQGMASVALSPCSGCPYGYQPPLQPGDRWYFGVGWAEDWRWHFVRGGCRRGQPEEFEYSPQETCKPSQWGHLDWRAIQANLPSPCRAALYQHQEAPGSVGLEGVLPDEVRPKPLPWAPPQQTPEQEVWFTNYKVPQCRFSDEAYFTERDASRCNHCPYTVTE